MKNLLLLARLIDRGNQAVGRAAAWLILITVVISTANALIRKLLDLPIMQDLAVLKAFFAFMVSHSNGFLEIQWILFSAVFLLAAAYTLQANEHVRIDLIYGRLGARAQAWIDLLGALLFVLPLCGVVLYYAWPFFLQSFLSQEGSNNPGGLPQWPAKFLLPMSFACLALQAVAEIIKRIGILGGHLAPPAGADHPPEHSA